VEQRVRRLLDDAHGPIAPSRTADLALEHGRVEQELARPVEILVAPVVAVDGNEPLTPPRISGGPSTRTVRRT
jgi:hypothetical protein